MRFDLEQCKRHSGRLDDSDVDYDGFRDRPLDPASLRCLRYMHDVEHHTACYLRDLLVTRAHTDPDITAFLSCWAYEELWHGEAIARVLAAHGETAGPERIRASRLRSRWSARLSPLGAMVASAFTPHVVALQMAWGAVNEWTTQAAYGRLLAVSQHPELAKLLRRVMRQEGRHIDFYASEATRRLGESRAAQQLTRRALRHLWGPVGSSVMPAEEVRHLTAVLFGGAGGWAAADRIDRGIHRLPGLDGLHLVSRRVGSIIGEAAPDRAPTAA
jgi:hypothetical protein